MLTTSNKNALLKERRICRFRRCAIFVATTVGMSLSFSVSLANAQTSTNNPYRSNSSAVDRLVNSRPASPIPSSPTYDGQVIRTSYERSPAIRTADGDGWTNEDVRGIAELSRETTTGRKPNFIEREKAASETPVKASAATPKKQHFGKLIANLGMNLAFVLLVGIGFMVIAKHWTKPEAAGTKNASSTSPSSLQVKEELVLDGKTKLRIVQWKDSEILVASDAEGVRSMVALTPAFSDTLDQLENDLEEQAATEPAKVVAEERPVRERQKLKPTATSKPDGIDDRLIQMLLDSANRSAAASKPYSSRGSK